MREGGPITDRDQSEYPDSIKRLTIAMQEIMGMGPAADNKNVVPPHEAKSTGRLESHNG